MGFIRKALGAVGKVAGKVAPIAGMIPGVGWGVGAGLAGLGMLGKAVGGDKGGGATDATPYRNRFDEAILGGGDKSAADADWYRQNARGFDAQGYLDRANRGAFDQFKTSFGENLRDLRGQQVGMGRGMGSGFGAQDEDKLFTGMSRDLNNTMNANAMQAAGLQQSNLHNFGGFAERGQNRYMDALAGRMNTIEGQNLQDKASKRSMWGGIGAGLLDAAGKIGGAYVASRGGKAA